MDYRKEPFDFKLFVLKMIGKWHQFLFSALAGAVIFGGCYYLYKVTYGPAKEFQAASVYYIEYAKDPKLDEPYSYFNEYTLNSWITTDAFWDKVLLKLSKELTKEQAMQYVTLTVPSDVRIVNLTVKTADPKLTMELLTAYDTAFEVFAQTQREIDSIVLQDMSKEAVQIKADIRTQRAIVLGGVLGLFAGSMYIILQYLLDDSIYLPTTLQKRHGLKVLGTDISEELSVNTAYAVKDKKRVALAGVKEGLALQEALGYMKEHVQQVEWVETESVTQCPQAVEKIRDCDGLILIVASAEDTSYSIDRVLSYYKQQDIQVLGAVLWNVDRQLLRRCE